MRWLFLSLIFPCMASAEDWPEFRGPTHQGQSAATGLPVEWSPTVRKNILWKVPLQGIGWSSPVVIGDRIYLTTAVPVGGDEKPDAERSLRALCLQTVDGKVIWDVEIFHQGKDAPSVHKKNSHASPTPVYNDGKIYVHFGHQGSACLNAMDGSVAWKTQSLAYKPVHGNGGSPVIEGDLFIYSADAEANPAVIALDKNTGAQRWKFDRVSDAKNKFSFSTPLVIEVNGQRQLISAGSGVVNALDPQTGNEIWKARYDQGYSVVPRPLYAHGMIYLSTGYNKPVALAIRADGQGDVTDTHMVWKIEKLVPHNPSMVVVGDEIYFVADNGVLTCADAKTGQIHYQERCTGPISASILAADGRLYLQDEKGLGVVVQPGKTFRILAKNDLAERSLASYAVVEDDFLIRTEGHLWRIGQKIGL
ncbi:Outer membrane protein assembly factor BamB, contains PQQ-like beta-propeller repeat [Prosthecobacter debontii]|uniref:Outer membrane protein assembly factor BamB, contains PQQ-like beta-propeller repeat n=2 Tax=Prosthecobacter debontii TaxID=48467 RepID=A0A1T4Z1L9_9BACT|nr:Outer membrane protein assembly factor BamB, contains PQQ-like beta-propeller repeat [Prosthecobacter debontii]